MSLRDTIHQLADEYDSIGVPLIFCGRDGPRIIGDAPFATCMAEVRDALDTMLIAHGLSASYLSKLATPAGSIAYVAHS